MTILVAFNGREIKIYFVPKMFRHVSAIPTRRIMEVDKGGDIYVMETMYSFNYFKEKYFLSTSEGLSIKYQGWKSCVRTPSMTDVWHF